MEICTQRIMSRSRPLCRELCIPMGRPALEQNLLFLSRVWRKIPTSLWETSYSDVSSHHLQLARSHQHWQSHTSLYLIPAYFCLVNSVISSILLQIKVWETRAKCRVQRETLSSYNSDGCDEVPFSALTKSIHILLTRTNQSLLKDIS